MKNNKGFTVFELLIGFIFLIMISYFLLTTIFSVRDRQQFTIIKNQLLDIKISLVEEIEFDLFKHKFMKLESCGTGCYNLKYATGLTRKLEIDTINNKIKYGDSEYILINGSYIKVPYNVSVLVLTDAYANRNNSILTINIPIEHNEIKGTFGIDINKPYNVHQKATPIVMTLNGDSVINIKRYNVYIEFGATAVSPSDGDISQNIIITNNVNTNNLGTYSVIYEATDSFGIIGAVTRTVNVIP